MVCYGMVWYEPLINCSEAGTLIFSLDDLVDLCLSFYIETIHMIATTDLSKCRGIYYTYLHLFPGRHKNM